MALSAVLLAAFIGFMAAGYGVLTGQVGLWGALGLYVSAGWAAIISLFISNFIIRQLRNSGDVLPDRMHQQSVVISKQPSHRRKTGA